MENAFLEPNKCWVNDNAMMAISKSNNIYFLYWLIRGMDLNSQSRFWSTTIDTSYIESTRVSYSVTYAIKRFDDQAKILVRNIFLMQREIIKSTELQSLLLAKMGQ